VLQHGHKTCFGSEAAASNVQPTVESFGLRRSLRRPSQLTEAHGLNR